MDDKNIPFPAAAAYPIVSKNKNSINCIFDGKDLIFVAVTDAVFVPFIISSGFNRKRNISIRNGIMFK